jgi:hypothetical protein
MDGADQLSWKPVEFTLRYLVSPEERATNIEANAGRPLPHVEFKGICICASGPSLADHLDDIRARKAAGWSVASMNGSHNFLIGQGIVPDYYFQIDAREGNLSFLEKANDHTLYIIASQCHPDTFEALAGRKVKLWHVFHDELGLEALRRQAPQATLFSGAYNVGQSCLNPILAMGYRRWALYGYDASMREGEKHAFNQPQNAGEEVRELMFNGRHYYATPTMAHHAATFFERYQLFRGLGIDIEIIGDGLLPDMIRHQAELVAIAGEAPQLPPPPRPRKKAVERLQIVAFKWQGHIPYCAEDVNVWARMIDRWLRLPHELVCVTDQPDGIDGSIRTVPLWRDHFEHGRDWHRLKLFSEEMADLIGPRFVCIDLDTVICGPIDPLFDHEAAFKVWRDPLRPHQYCTSVFQMDAGAFPHVYESFDVSKALALRHCGRYNGYDQAWISHVLPGQPVWTEQDGVLSFKRNILNADTLEASGPSARQLPAHARIVNFHGKYNPRDPAVQAAMPWIARFYR